MKTLGYLALIPMITFGISAYSQPGYYPPPANVSYHNDILTICPPDSLPGEPIVLLAYNILVDSVFFDDLPVTNPTDTLDYIFTFPALPPGAHSFCVNAVYNQWISDQVCDSATVIYGYELPFLEDWSSGSFEELQWTSSSDNWVISEEEGNPAPAVEFRGGPVQTDYSESVESFPINATGLTEGRIWLDFDLKLDCLHPTGAEMLRVEIWNWTHKVWDPVAEFDNSNGSFMWEEQHINIQPKAIKEVFKVRFLSTGVNSSNIQGWFVDNIHLYRSCEAPSDLVIDEFPDHNKLSWNGFGTCGGIDPWIHWDDGYNSGNSFGTGEPIEFDVAIRWEAAQLDCFEGASVLQVAYFPVENTANYRIRIWSGTGPDTLLYDEPAYPIAGQWNTKTLAFPQPIDNKKDLWIGYHVITTNGYPAGMDNGPAINNYGNMIFYEGAWKTLLEVNPDLNYNWNISCHLWPITQPPNPEINYKIYRQTNVGEFQLYDVTGYESYLDSNIILSENYCYKVTASWAGDGDTCESAPTNTVCESINIGIDQHNQDQSIKIYPNPVKNRLNIESKEEIREVRIYNLLGEEELKLEIGNLEAQVDVSQLQSGIYYVNVTTVGSEYKEKIVIIR